MEFHDSLVSLEVYRGVENFPTRAFTKPQWIKSKDDTIARYKNVSSAFATRVQALEALMSEFPPLGEYVSGAKAFGQLDLDNDFSLPPDKKNSFNTFLKGYKKYMVCLTKCSKN